MQDHQQLISQPFLRCTFSQLTQATGYSLSSFFFVRSFTQLWSHVQCKNTAPLYFCTLVHRSCCAQEEHQRKRATSATRRQTLCCKQYKWICLHEHYNSSRQVNVACRPFSAPRKLQLVMYSVTVSSATQSSYCHKILVLCKYHVLPRRKRSASEVFEQLVGKHYFPNSTN